MFRWQRLKLCLLVGPISHAWAENQFKILPMEKLGLFNVGCLQSLDLEVLLSLTRETANRNLLSSSARLGS